MSTPGEPEGELVESAASSPGAGVEVGAFEPGAAGWLADGIVVREDVDATAGCIAVGVGVDVTTTCIVVGVGVDVTTTWITCPG